MLWSSTYETGVPVIDEQHKELFSQVDILLDNGKADRVPATLNFLADYVIKHFAAEEGLQAKSAYPKAAEHKTLHTDFIATYKDLRKECDSSGQSAIVLMKLSRTALAWLREHIRAADKEFAFYYKRATDGKA